MDQARVARMRQLLAESVNVNPDADFTGIVFHRNDAVMRGMLRRRAMIKQVQLAARHYDLQLEIDAYLAEADRASLSGLDNQQLSALSQWVSGVIDRIATCCDSPDAPPAR